VQREKLVTQRAKNLSHWVTSFHDRVSLVSPSGSVERCSDLDCNSPCVIDLVIYLLASLSVSHSVIRLTLVFEAWPRLKLNVMVHFSC